jgi:hypothetical protein
MFGDKLVDKLGENLEQPIIVPMHCKTVKYHFHMV